MVIISWWIFEPKRKGIKVEPIIIKEISTFHQVDEWKNLE